MAVHNLGGAFSDLALQFLGKRRFDRKRNFVTKVMLNVMFLLKYFTSLFRLYFNFKGVMVGEKHKEFGIARNQRLLVFGDVFFDKVQRSFAGGLTSLAPRTGHLFARQAGPPSRGRAAPAPRSLLPLPHRAPGLPAPGAQARLPPGARALAAGTGGLTSLCTSGATCAG